MLTFPALLFLTYAEWYLRTYERMVVYPFDETRTAPAEAGEPRLTETLATMADGTRLVVWTAPPAEGNPTLLYLPGNAGPLSSRAPRMSRLIDRGFGVVALAYRGSSGSEGKPEEALLTADALAVYDAIEGPVILYGESLGTALAVKIAAEREALAVILESPFTSFPAIAAVQYPEIDLRNAMTQHWDTAAHVGAVTEPMLVMHGTDDRLVPFAQGEEVFRRAGSADKRLARIEAKGHGGLFPGAAETALYGFLDRF